MSKAEEKFCSVFKKEGISFVREKVFSDFRNGLLRYDFFLPKMGVLIEYDSEIHFMMVSKFHKNI